MASAQKIPKKGILKSSSSFDQAEAQRSKEMKWDEMNILATHHPPGKEYGHMKIDEPPTPYSKYSDQEDELEDEEGGEARRGSVGAKDNMDPTSLTARLEGIEGQRLRRVSTTDDDSSEEDEELTEEQLALKRKFKEKRKIHYNEFQAVKLAKQLMEEEDVDDDDDDANTNAQNIVKMQTDQSGSPEAETTEAQSLQNDGNSGITASGSKPSVVTPEGLMRDSRETLID